MSQIASKNLYELLGNDPELDPDRAPDPPTKVVDKPAPRTGKRNPGPDGPGDSLRAGGGGRGGSFQAPGRGDQAGLNNRDDGLRSDRNSNRTREPREYRGDGRGRGRGRGGRGGRGGAPRDDRHSHTGIAEHEKQAAHGWGGDDGNAEWADEKAGEAIANAETNNDPGATPDTRAQDPAFGNGPDAAGEEDAAPEEEQTKSYDQYLADLAEKRMALGDNLNVRKPNEGASKTFPEGKAISRTQEENFFIGSGGKNKKAKEAQDKKERLTLDGQYYAAADSGDRGGRGRGRGGDRGGGRGGRGGEFRGGDRGRGGGRGRGEFRGGRGGDRGDRAERGDRGGRGGARGGFNATDESAFPALS